MPVTSYDELKTEIQNWLGDDDVADFVDSFIASCEANIRRNVRVDEIRVKESVAIAANTRTLSLAATLTNEFQDMDYIRIRRPAGEEALYFPPLVKVGLEEMTDLAHETALRPSHYSISGDELEFNRPLDREYTAEFFHFKKFTALSASDQSNEILVAYPDLYLWGSLTAAAPFIDNDDRIGVWSSLYQQALADIRKSNAKRNIVGPIRQQTRGIPHRRRY